MVILFQGRQGVDEGRRSFPDPGDDVLDAVGDVDVAVGLLQAVQVVKVVAGVAQRVLKELFRFTCLLR